MADGGLQLSPSNFGRSSYLGTTDLFREKTRLEQVRDGQSVTFAFGETNNERAWALPGTGSCSGQPNSGGAFSSRHTGGVNFVFLDGAVKFIKNTIDSSTYKALETFSGEETLGEF